MGRFWTAAVIAGLASAQAARAEEPGGETPPEPRPEERTALLEEVEVVATGFARDRGTSTVPIFVLDGEWFDEHQVSSVADGLRHVPGATVARGGMRGAATSLFLRGAGSNQVLVVQDGMPLNDPTAGGQFNFFDFDALNLDRVEVLRGSYGVLYGSSAIGGVVDVVSRRGRGAPSFRASAEAGSFGGRRESLTGGGGDDAADWSFGMAETAGDGLHERQRFRSLSFSGLFGARVWTDARAELAVRALDSSAEDPYDFGTPLPKDSDIRREREILSLGASLEKPLDTWLTGRLRVSLTDVDSAFRNGGNSSAAAPEFTSTLEATTTVVGATLRAVPWDLEPKGSARMEVVAGADYRTEESLGFSDSPFSAGQDLDETTRNGAGFLLATSTTGPVTVTGGGRYDHHSQAGGEWSPQAGVRFDVERTGTGLRANYGQGFRAATPAEFTDPFVGNPDLGPERSESVDVGVDQEIAPGVRAEATWFRLKTRDLIAFDPVTSKLQNIDRTRVPGYEIGVRADVGGGLSLMASYTHQRPRNEGTGARLPNRPDSFGSLGAGFRRGDWTLTADLLWQGAIDDLGAKGPDQELRDHAGRRVVLDLGARWRATKALTVSARIENAGNARYVETPYAPRGTPFSLFAGASIEF